jgi:mono/diheme cytochrome c family protein
MRTGQGLGRAALAGRLLAALALAAATSAGVARGGDDEPCCEEGPTPAQLAEGRALFLREWMAGPTEHGGDGLGPVFNDSSCVACHNAGGPGGGGPNSKNVDIVTASPNGMVAFDMPQVPRLAASAPSEPSFKDRALEALFGIDPPVARPEDVPARGVAGIGPDGVRIGDVVDVDVAAPAVVPTAPAPRKPDRGPLIAAHAGFRTSNSVVLHRFSTEPDYEAWRANLLGLNGMFLPAMADTAAARRARADAEIQSIQLLTQARVQDIGGGIATGEFSLAHSQRNPTALFGSGLIDRIPDSAIEAQAALRHEGFPEIAGRVARGKDGRIGRFGWKAQTPTLEDFVLTACAVELGLEVPGHSQGGLPSKPEYKPAGLDLTAEQCASLTAYVRALARPTRAGADHPDVRAGERLFASIGCAECHAPRLGDVEGIYSDLLVHDLGPTLGDVGQYGVFVPDSSEPDVVDEPPGPIASADVDQGAVPAPDPFPAEPPIAATALSLTQRAGVIHDPTVVQVFTTPDVAVTPVEGFGPGGFGVFGVAPRPASGPAGRQEWRTPPLWGLRDSGPYLHDGRADTVEEAIALHGGEGSNPARNYFALTPAERRQLLAFLKSLTAPEPPALAQAGK